MWRGDIFSIRRRLEGPAAAPALIFRRYLAKGFLIQHRDDIYPNK